MYVENTQYDVVDLTDCEGVKVVFSQVHSVLQGIADLCVMG